MKRFNATQIKYLLVMLMLLNHLCYIDGFIPTQLAFVFTLLSRCVAPMFSYFVVEGIRYTSNLKKYCVRLALLAGIVFIGNTVINSSIEALIKSEQDFVYRNNNVIFTLALCVIAIACIKWSASKRSLGKGCCYLVATSCFVIGFLWGEWGSVLLPLMFLEYFFEHRLVIRVLGYVLIELVALLLPFGEPFYILALPVMLLYNGEHGRKSTFSKYFFYVFYPLHLWVIYVLNYIVNYR